MTDTPPPIASPPPPAPAGGVVLQPEADRLYRAARAVIAFAMRRAFRRIEIRGAENIPASGPLLLAANHPSGIVDSFGIGLATGRKVHFVARSTLFDAPWRARLLSRLGVIPIYRKMDAAAEMGRNADVFRSCYALLEAGGVIGIFPEGITHVDPQVKEMRTGAMRIGLGAEAGRDFDLGVRVVPIGINFSQPGAQRSDLLLRVGTPIVLSRHAEAYRRDPVATVNALTDELRERIESLVIHLDDLTQAPIVDAAFDVFGADWIADPRILPEIGDEATRRIEVKRVIGQAVEYYSRFQPAWALDLQRRIAAYRAALERARLTDEMVHREVGALPLLRQTLPAAVIGVVGAPLAGFGWLINRLPRRVTTWIAKRFAANPTQLAAWELWIGLQAFVLSYAAVFLLLRRWADFGRAEAIAALLLLPIVGWLSSRWFALVKHWMENVRLTYYHALRRGRIEQLRFARELLRRDQEKLRGLVVGEKHPSGVDSAAPSVATHREREPVYRATRFEVNDGAVQFTIRVDERCDALDALLAGHGAADWAYVTAHNPHGQARDAAANEVANAELEREIELSGRAFFRGQGVGADGAWAPEASFLILGIPLEEAIALARRWEQEAIVAGTRGEPAALVWC